MWTKYEFTGAALLGQGPKAGKVWTPNPAEYGFVQHECGLWLLPYISRYGEAKIIYGDKLHPWREWCLSIGNHCYVLEGA